MGRANVLYKNKYSCFSSIVDTFITKPMNKKDYEHWLLAQYGTYNFRPVGECYNISIEDMLYILCV